MSVLYLLKENDGKYESYLSELNNVFDTFSLNGIVEVKNKTIGYVGKVI